MLSREEDGRGIAIAEAVPPPTRRTPSSTTVIIGAAASGGAAGAPGTPHAPSSTAAATVPGATNVNRVGPETDATDDPEARRKRKLHKMEAALRAGAARLAGLQEERAGWEAQQQQQAAAVEARAEVELQQATLELEQMRGAVGGLEARIVELKGALAGAVGAQLCYGSLD